MKRWVVLSFLGANVMGCAMAAPSPGEGDLSQSQSQALVEPSAGSRPDIVFERCSEFAGVNPLPAADAEALVPDSFEVLVSEGMASLVVRVADCENIQVGRGRGRPGRMSQIGINIAGDNSGQSITNYTLWYVTDNRALHSALKAQGLSPIYDCDISYSVNGGALSFGTHNGDSPDYTASGVVSDPSVPLPFVATWIEQGRRGAVAARTVLPDIVFDFGASITLETPAGSELAELAGTTTLTFPYLNSYNTFERAEAMLSRL